MNKGMSDGEWDAFMDAIPTGTVSPFGTYQEYLAKEGVTEEDNSWWEGLTIAEQEKIKDEQQSGLAHIMVMYSADGTMSPHDAMVKIYKETTSFADYPFAEQVILQLKKHGFTNEDDYPLPWPLHTRLNSYSEMMTKDTERFMESQSFLDLEGTPKLRHLF